MDREHRLVHFEAPEPLQPEPALPEGGSKDILTKMTNDPLLSDLVYPVVKAGNFGGDGTSNIHTRLVEQHLNTQFKFSSLPTEEKQVIVDALNRFAMEEKTSHRINVNHYTFGLRDGALSYGRFGPIEYHKIPKYQTMSPQEFIDSFDSNLPGIAAANTEIMNTPGAKYCLVHIRQKHGNPNDTHEENLRKLHAGDVPEQRAVQTDIHAMFSAAHRIYGPIKIWNEGLSQERHYTSRTRFIADLHRDYQKARDLVTTMQGFMRKPQLNEAQRQLLLGQIQETEEMMAKITKDIRAAERDIDANYLAAGRLSREGKVTLVPAEDPEAQKRTDIVMMEFERASAAFTANPNPQLADVQRIQDITNRYKNTLYSDREDALLRNVSQSSDTIAFTVFGGAHDWTDNVQKWNQVNPDKKFSLITITPKSYARFEAQESRGEH